MLDLVFNRRRLLSDSKLFGRWGERRSEKFLKRKGLKTLTRNFTCRTGEIDLVMVDSDASIVFVEVKTRKDESFAQAESAITSTKKQRLIRAAKYFVSTNNIAGRALRFDVVTIILGEKGKPQIKHYPSAFVP